MFGPQLLRPCLINIRTKDSIKKVRPKSQILWRHITANIHAPPRVDIEVIFNFEHADQSTYFCH